MISVRGRLGATEFALELGHQVTAVAGPAARDLLATMAGGRRRSGLRAAEISCDGRVCAPARSVAFVDGAAPRPRRSRVGSLLRRSAREGRGREDLDQLVAALRLDRVWADRPRQLDPPAWRRVALAAALLRGRRLLAVAAAPGETAAVRRATWTLARWARDARDQQIVYIAPGTRDLEDLADQLVVATDEGVFGPDEPWELLGRTLRGVFAEEFVVESVVRASVDYLDEEGRWLRVLVAGAEVYLPFERLSPGWVGRVAIRPDAVLVLREPLPGPRLTNQLRGEIVELGELLGRCRVDVDVGDGDGTRLRAVVESETVREQGFERGARVICAFEPAAVRWIG